MSEIEKDNMDMDLRPQIIEKKTLDLTQHTNVDMTGLPDEMQHELTKQHISGQIENQRKAAEAGIDAKVLDTKLKTIGTQVGEAIEAGADITISNVKEDSMGRTEIISGNSEAAQKGKLTRSQQGKRGSLLGWIFGK